MDKAKLVVALVLVAGCGSHYDSAAMYYRSPCETPTDCKTGYCDLRNNICFTELHLGAPCTTDYQCETNQCEGFCTHPCSKTVPCDGGGLEYCAEDANGRAICWPACLSDANGDACGRFYGGGAQCLTVVDIYAQRRNVCATQ